MTLLLLLVPACIVAAIGAVEYLIAWIWGDEW